MRIRPFEDRDLDDVLRMVRELFVEDPSPHSPGDSNVRRTLGVITDERRGAVWIADDGEGTPPFGYMFLTKAWSNELGGDLVFIDELWVEPARRCRGIGTALLEHAIAMTKGAVAFELEVTRTNARARALYERLGFRPLQNASRAACSAPPAGEMIAARWRARSESAWRVAFSPRRCSALRARRPPRRSSSSSPSSRTTRCTATPTCSRSQRRPTSTTRAT